MLDDVRQVIPRTDDYLQVIRHLPHSRFVPSFIKEQVHEIIARTAASLSGEVSIVMVTGEAGTEKEDIASYLFRQQQQGDNPSYIEFYPWTPFSEAWPEFLKKHDGSTPYTVFFQDFDQLGDERQADIIHAILLKKCRHATLVFSLSQPLEQAMLAGAVHPLMSRCPPIQEINLSPLRERPFALHELLLAAFKEYRQSADQSLATEVWEQLMRYGWPGNAHEVRHAMARLLMLGPARLISLEQARLCLPDILCLDEGDGLNRLLCDMVLRGDEGELSRFHPSVAKALLYLGQHFKQDICLQELADKSHVSQSHLSYLLRNTFNLSFKQILNQVRVFYAQKQLQSQPRHRVTELCMNCGFGDLSHFEKIFKRYSGMSPLAFKKKVINTHGLRVSALVSA